MTTHYSKFFSLKSFAHAEIFENTTHVWEALSRISSYLQKLILQSSSEIPTGVYLENPSQIYLGKGVSIEPGAFIRGPCFIGDGTSIRHGAYIRGDVITGTHCVIGHGTEIKNSILLDHVCVSHFNYVGDSILGKNVNLGAGVKCANFRLDHNEVHIRIGEDKLNTGLQKLGAIIGDDGQIGCNCVTNPGTLLPPNVKFPPCQAIGSNSKAGLSTFIVTS